MRYAESEMKREPCGTLRSSVNMNGTSDIGEKLVHNFTLLLQYCPDDKCQEYVRKDMLSIPGFEATQHIVSFLVNVINPNWRTKALLKNVTFVDWNNLYSIACDEFNNLRKEYPDWDIQFMVPSVLKCFYGPKCRNILWKLTSVIMLLVMKRYNFNEDVAEKENCTEEIKEILEENNYLKREIEEAQKRTEDKFFIKKETLSCLLGHTPWQDRKLLLDITNNSLISELKEEILCKKRVLENLKRELTPHLECLFQDMGTFQNSAASSADLLEHYLLRSKIENHLQIASENFLRRHVQNLMLAEELRSIQNVKEGTENEPQYTSLIRRLESLNTFNVRTNFVENNNSPLVVNHEDSSMDIIDTSTPKEVGSGINFQKQSLTIDSNSVASLVVPPKMKSSLPSLVFRNGNEVPSERTGSLTDILQRMKLKSSLSSNFSRNGRSEDSISSCLDRVEQCHPHSVPPKLTENRRYWTKWKMNCTNGHGEPNGTVRKVLNLVEFQELGSPIELKCAATSDIPGILDTPCKRNQGMIQESDLSCDFQELKNDILRIIGPLRTKSSECDELLPMENTPSSTMSDSFSSLNMQCLAKEIDCEDILKMEADSSEQLSYSSLSDESLNLLNSFRDKDESISMKEIRQIFKKLRKN